MLREGWTEWEIEVEIRIARTLMKAFQGVFQEVALVSMLLVPVCMGKQPWQLGVKNNYAVRGKKF